MKIRVRFDSQVRRLAACKEVSLEVDQAATLEQIIQRVAFEGTEPLRAALLDDEQCLRTSILVFLNHELVTKDRPFVLHEGAELTLTTLISGG